MLKKIVMPAAGQTTDAATVVSIKASVGDKVKRGDVLLEVETDKATLPIESVDEAMAEALARARSGEGPTIIEVKTYRKYGHSRNDACGY